MAGKDSIRREMLAERLRRGAESAGDCDALTRRIVGLEVYRQAAAVAGFMATRGETDLDGIIRSRLASGLAIWLPRFDEALGGYCMVAIESLDTDVRSGKFGILEPVPTLQAVPRAVCCAENVLWLVPGVAFDSRGNRLGRGRGYYDRLLTGANGVRVGVAWDWQVLTDVPHTDQDERMDWIVTDRRAIACGGTPAVQA